MPGAEFPPLRGTDGTIYSSDVGSLKNIATRGDKEGHAVRYSSFYRNSTLGAADNISTGDTLPTASGQTVGNWTKQ